MQEFSSSNVPISRETWAPRSPVQPAEDRYSERAPVPAHDVDMPERRESRDARDDRDDRDDRDRRDDRDERGGPGGYDRNDRR